MSILHRIAPAVPEKKDVFHIHLRKSIERIHSEIERGNPLLSPNLSIAEYQSYIKKMHGFYAPIEARFDGFNGYWDKYLFDIYNRKKGQFLIQDLLSFNIDPQCVQLCQDIPDLSTFENSVGCLYVLEGSALGGQVILKHLETGVCREFHKERGGFTYLKGYGAATRPLWNKFILSIDKYADMNPRHHQRIVDSAVETFDKFGRWLGGKLT